MYKLDFVVQGRVQGIGFRRTIKNFARKNDLTGYVKNNSDGNVEGSLQGSKKKLEEFIEWVKNGPIFSDVKKLKYKINEIKTRDKKFKILKEDNFFVDKFKALSHLKKNLIEKEELKIPRHFAIIPDGNRRWAKKRGLAGFKGHEKAGETDNMISLFERARELGVEYVSFWGFSTENWKREKQENDKLFSVLLKGIDDFLKYAHDKKVRFRHFGRKDRLPKDVLEALERLEKETEKYSESNVQLCLDYGGRDEIIRAVNKLLEIKAKKISEEQFCQVLDSKGVPEPDLIVRTSGEKRLSGYMPWQGIYSELIFVDKYFPDFTPDDVEECVKEFGKRKRRFGGN